MNKKLLSVDHLPELTPYGMLAHMLTMVSIRKLTPNGRATKLFLKYSGWDFEQLRAILENRLSEVVSTRPIGEDWFSCSYFYILSGLEWVVNHGPSDMRDSAARLREAGWCWLVEQTGLPRAELERDIKQARLAAEAAKQPLG